MKRKTDRLDQRLGDFGPLRQPINELQVERLLDRYGIALVCDYPQILFERQDQLLLPGWRYRGMVDEYPRFTYGWPSPRDAGEPAGELPRLRLTEPSPPDRQWGRVSEARQILDEIYAPVRRMPQPRQGRSNYEARAHSPYS